MRSTRLEFGANPGRGSRGKRVLYANLLLLGILLYHPTASGQIRNGAWRDHLPYNSGKRLAKAGNKIYCATSAGGLFSINKTDNSLQKYSKVNGLSDADISTIGYSKNQQTLVIGYSNGNVDLIRHDSIINLPDIKRKNLVGDKAIYNFFFTDNYAYMACGFGIVVCDLAKKEMKDSYLFGPGGSQIHVNDITSDGHYLYAATEQGIYKADLTGSNLVDFNAWIKIGQLPDPTASYRCLAWYTGRLFTLYDNPISGKDDIIVVDENGWTYWKNNQEQEYGFLGEQDGNLLVCGEAHTWVYDSNEQPTLEIGSYYGKHAILDDGDILWYADPISGLMRMNPHGPSVSLFPDGPAFRSAGDMDVKNGKLWVGGGTDATQWANYGAYSFIDEHWQNYNNLTVPQLEGFLNISKVCIDPADDSHVIGGSTGYGLVEFRNNQFVQVFDETNSILKPIPGYGHGYIRVTGLSFDPNGYLWVSTTLSDQPVYRRKPDGDWETVKLNYGNFGVETRVGQILATSAGQVWLLIQNDGILVFTADRENNPQERFFAVQNQIPDLLDRVYCMTEDLDGDIWVGTNKGPVVYYNAADIFTESDVSAYQPEIPRNDGTNFVDLLLSTEKINAIAVDGANQKWIATEKSGVFLVSADGKKEIHHFNADNSPLFSDNVLTVAVNDRTGEVFFGTDKGMLSYRGQATEGGSDFGKVYAFPNPVRENYVGDITITGLVRDANVKITDVSGNLVYETTSLGGQAIWDGRNFHGQRVHTGVYLVFCASPDGSKTRVTKLLFIH